MPRTLGRSAAACSRRQSRMLVLGASSFARGSLRQQGRDPHQVVGEHRSAYEQLEALAALGETALHAATAEQHGDASLDTGPKALPVLEGGTLLECFPLGR